LNRFTWLICQITQNREDGNTSQNTGSCVSQTDYRGVSVQPNTNKKN
jgi:hypothetical protein